MGSLPWLSGSPWKSKGHGNKPREVAPEQGLSSGSTLMMILSLPWLSGSPWKSKGHGNKLREVVRIQEPPLLLVVEQLKMKVAKKLCFRELWLCQWTLESQGQQHPRRGTSAP